MSELKDFNRMFSLDGKVALVTGGKIINRPLSKTAPAQIC